MHFVTTDGTEVEVIDPGLYNRRDQGPDFFNAKVRIGGMLLVGNVEVHQRSSDWYAHHHDRDEAYNNVVLHVVGTADAEVVTASGVRLPQVVVSVPEAVQRNYQQLLATDHYPPCYSIIPSLSRIKTHAWMAALQTERLEQKTAKIRRRAEQADGSMEAAYFITLSRNFGFGINSEAFEQWAQSVPLGAIGKHRDDLFQIEAIFLGQAGLLDLEAVPERYREVAAADDYFVRLRSEYAFLRHKFGLTPVSHTLWRFLRLRPQNFPHVRLAQLAALYCRHSTDLSLLLDCQTIADLQRLLKVDVSPYWQTHYLFGHESPASRKQLSAASIALVAINTAVPMLFAMGRHQQKEALCDRAFDLLEQLRPERNHIITMWQECGLDVATAGDSQALIQLKREYCDRRDCLRCRFGYEYLSAP